MNGATRPPLARNPACGINATQPCSPDVPRTDGQGTHQTIMSADWMAPLAAFVTCWLTLAGLLRRRHVLPMDHPNARSLHVMPTPRIGGLGIMAGFVAASVWLADTALLPAMLGALALGGVSLVDDVRGLPIWLRFLAHFIVAVGCLLAWGLTGWLLLAGVLGVVWMTNLYNFMDGADGLAGGMAVIGFAALAAAAGWAGDQDLAVFCAAIAAAALAFLRFNFPLAKVFMGDAGSIPLGFLAASIGVYGTAQNYWSLLFPVIIFSPFILDASVTLLKRALRGEKIWHAHREHYYQRLVRMGWSHKKMTLAAYAFMLFCAMLGLTYHQQTESAVLLVMLWTGSFLLIFVALDRRWSRLKHEI